MTFRRGKKLSEEQRELLDDLSSLVEGLYSEFEKLSKKDPYAMLSDLATRRLNRAIADARTVMAGRDRYLADIEEFDVSVGNPEVRDAVLVLQEIRKAAERTDGTLGDLLS